MTSTLGRGVVAVMSRACCWIIFDGNRPARSMLRLKGTNESRNIFESNTCGTETRLAGRERPRAQTVGPSP